MPTSNEQSKQPSKPRKSARTSKSGVATAISETEVPLAAAAEGNGASAESTVKATSHQQQTEHGGADIDARIRQRAYEIYLARGYSTGNELDDWLEAERQLRSAPSQTNGRASDDATA